MTWSAVSRFIRGNFRFMNFFFLTRGSWLRPLAGMIVLVCFAEVQPGAWLRAAESARPGAAGREPEAQVESDWVDNRWSRTDVGQFLASNLQPGGMRIAKGLSIKVGDEDEGGVCYDTRDCSLRAAWLGGFLRLDPARFGLLNAPRIDGEVAIASPANGGWQGTSNRYIGLHLHGKRVVLEYRVDETRVLDSPWLISRGDLKWFTRSLELAPHSRELKLVLAGGGADVSVTPGERFDRAVVTR